MPRYIDADELINKLSRMIDYCKKDNKVTGLTALFQVGDAVIDCKTADVAPVIHAEWILDEDSSSDEEECYRCSNCKAVLEEDYKWHCHNYCYHCGARMDKKEATYIKDIFMTR